MQSVSSLFPWQPEAWAHKWCHWQGGVKEAGEGCYSAAAMSLQLPMLLPQLQPAPQLLTSTPPWPARLTSHLQHLRVGEAPFFTSEWALVSFACVILPPPKCGLGNGLAAWGSTRVLWKALGWNVVSSCFVILPSDEDIFKVWERIQVRWGKKKPNHF